MNAATAGSCRLYGLDIDSELDLHVRRPAMAGGPDVRVELGEVVPPRGEAVDGDLMAQWATASGLVASFVRRPDGSHHLRFESTCDVVVDRRLESLVVHPHVGTPEAMAGVLVGGTVLSWVLMLRDALVLHASAVDVGGRAIGFVGSSGMGKTTLATLLCRGGGLLLTDDVLRLTPDGAGGHLCSLGATELRLRESAASLADEFTQDGARRTADDRQALSVPVATEEDVPLAALLIPRPNRSTCELSLTRVPASAATLSLLSFPRILGIRDPGLLAAEFVRTTELVERVPVLVADVPWGPPFAADTAPRLLDELDRHLDRQFDPHLDRQVGAPC